MQHHKLAFLKHYLLAALLLCLGACSSGSLAPVVIASPNLGNNNSSYRVNRGDTIYSIAWAYGLDYRALAAANHLGSTYQIRPGQVLTLRVGTVVNRSSSTRTSTQYQQSNFAVHQHHKTAVISRHRSLRVASPTIKRWQWPVRGRVVMGFSSRLDGNHGIDIAGRVGQPVLASAGGRVVYAGSGIRGYGNLIIIKHNANYLTAYAYNHRLVVHLGEQVKAGQQIATVGRDNAGRPALHFEIRRNGKPVNPSRYLQ